jgi:hypothetical protein
LIASFMSAVFRALQMLVQDGAHGAIVAPYNRRLLRQQPLQPAAAAAVTITAAVAMLLVAAVMCLRWRKRTRQQQQQSHAQQQQQQECNDAQLKVPHVVTQQACYGYSSSNSSSQSHQQQQQHMQLQATQPSLAAAAQQLIKQLLPLCDQRRCSSSRALGCSSTSTADSSVTVAAAAGSTTAAGDVQLSVLPMGPDAYRNSTAAGHSRCIQHGMSCRVSNSSISSSGRSDSASSVDAAMGASQSNPDSIAVDAASSAAVSPVAANSSSTNSLGPLTTLLTEANLLRCVTPDNASSSRYNSHTIFELESQPARHAAAAAALGAASPGFLLRQLHTSASSSTGGDVQPLHGVDAALPCLQTRDGDARGLPTVVIGTLTRTQAAAIKFGECCRALVWLAVKLTYCW